MIEIFELFLKLSENVIVNVDEQLYVHIFVLYFTLVFCFSMMRMVRDFYTLSISICDDRKIILFAFYAFTN